MLYAATRWGEHGATFADGRRNLYASAVLVDDYKLDPNGTLDDGRPLLVALRDKGPLRDYNLSALNFSGNLNFNVLFNGEPLIFDTPNTLYGELDFRTLFWYIRKNFWEVTNNMDANPIHIAANAFKLPDVMPGFNIPKEHINAPDKFGNTYLHYAYHGPYADVNVPWLLKQGANPNIPNNFGDVPANMIYKKLTTLGQGE